MKRLSGVSGTIFRRWDEARPGMRLAIGAAVLAAVGLTGLTPNVVLGQTLVWPYAAMVAAAGWGRSGLAFAPMAALVFFGLAQDVTSGAPIGCFALVNVLIFGASAGLNQMFDADRAGDLGTAVPLICIALGFVLVWLIASLSGGHVAKVLPLVTALVITVLFHIITAPLFDLGIRRGQNAGSAL
ncbi:MAG: hypothetical protein AAGA24_05070 [Pseudomonadota bacterium]